MRSLKFILLRIVIDVLFVFLLYKGYYLSVTGTISIKDISPSLFLGLLIGVAAYTFKTQGLLNSAANVVMCFVMYEFYIYAVKDNVDILYSSFGPSVLLRGFLGLVIASVLFTVFKKVFTSYLKVAQIYCISSEHDKTIIGSLIGAIARCNYTFSIPIINNMLHKTFHEIFTKSTTDTSPAVDNDTDETESVDNTSNSNTLQQLQNKLSKVKDSPIGKLTKGMLNIYISYLDECILAYCYRHDELKMHQAMLQGIKLAIKNAPKLFAKIAVVSVLNYLVRFMCIIGFLMYSYNTHITSFIQLVIYYIVFKGISFVLQDAVLEPLVMSGIVNTYCKLDQDTEESPTGAESNSEEDHEGTKEDSDVSDNVKDVITDEELLKLAPSLKKLLKHLE